MEQQSPESLQAAIPNRLEADALLRCRRSAVH